MSTSDEPGNGSALGRVKTDRCRPDRSAGAPIPLALIDELAIAESLEEIIGAFCRWFDEASGADRTSVAMVTDESGSHFDLLALSGLDIIPAGSRVPVKGTTVGRAMTERRPVIISDLTEHDAIDIRKLTEAGLRSSIAIPLVGRGVCFGTLNLAHREPHFFDEFPLLDMEPVIKLLLSHMSVHEQVTRQQRSTSIDELTGVLSRRAILETLRQGIDRAGPQGIATLYVDLDGFKQVNDTYGHAVGDRLLQEVARRFVGAVRPTDTVGRLGGDEFLIVLAADTTDSALMRVARRLERACEAPVDLGLYSVSVSASIGAAMTSGRGTTAAEMLVEADLAMYHAKRSGLSIVVADDEIARQADRIATIDRELEAELEGGALGFHYQPIRQLQGMKVLGAEALLRWHHPVHGPIPPPLIVERIEALGLMSRFTEWTLRTGAADLLELRRLAPAFGDKSISVNLTAHQLGCSDFMALHAETLERFRLRPIDIIIEVVESGLVEVGDVAERTLRELGDRGCIIALDDFGTGHNVLGYFAQFPVNAIKFDRSLIEAMVESERVRALLRGLSQVANGLDIYTLAEGIERPEQVDLSIDLGIGKGQGYLLGRPMPLRALSELDHRQLPTSASQLTPG